MEDAVLYRSLAALLEYPGDGYREAAENCRQALAEANPQAATLLADFIAAIRELSTEDLEELFTRTFDLNPLCSLEVGWHLFGENYDRGAFLVKMRQEMRRYGVPESVELPDHLTHVLAVLGRMDPERAEEFAATCVIPAVRKMSPGFAGNQNPFESVMKAIWSVLHSRYPYVPLQAQDAPALRVLE